jgi:GNAT superfamily N-acetyltransferase
MPRPSPRPKGGETAGDGVMSGEVRAVARELRDRGLVGSFDRVLRRMRGDPRASLLDVLIESHPDLDDGGSRAADRRVPAPGPGGGRGREGAKVATHLGVAVAGGEVASVARMTFYGDCAPGAAEPARVVAVLSMVGTLDAHRRKGLASEVVRSMARAHPGAEVRLTVDADNGGAMELYRKMGFEKRGRASGGLVGLALPPRDRPAGGA